MNLDDIIEKIKRLENGGNGSNMVCFIVAFDFLYFLKDNDKRERFIHEYYKNDNGMFTSNFKRVCNYAESILVQDNVYFNMLKSIEMDVNRDELVSMYNYYDAIDRIEKANNSTKDMISDSFKIRLLKQTFDSSNDDYIKLSENVKELKTRYEKNVIDIVCVVAIFIAITIGMVSGISFSLQAFNNVSSLNLVSICLTALVVGFVIYNLFYVIFKFVCKICGKEIDLKGYYVYTDVVFVSLIVFFTFLALK